MSSYNIDDDIREQQEEVTKTEDDINFNIKQIKEGLENFKTDTNEDLKNFESHKTSLKKEQETWKSSFAKIMSSLRSLSKESFEESAKVAAYVLKWFVSIMIAFSVAVLVLYFVFVYDYPDSGVIPVNGTYLDWNSIYLIAGIVVIDLILGISIWYGNRSIRETINQTSDEFNNNIIEVNDIVPPIGDKNIFDKLQPYLKLQENVSFFDNLLNNFATNSQEFVPIIKKLYATISRRNLQYQYRRSMKNALGMYGLYNDPPEQLVKAISQLNSPHDNEDSWLNRASQKISDALFMHTKLKLDPQVIKFMYSDYANTHYVENEWRAVRDEPNFLKQLTYVLSSRVLKITVQGSDGVFQELIKKSEPFRLKSFEQNSYDFFVDFEKKRSAMRIITSLLKFDPDDVKSKIDTFFPSSLSSSTWDEEFVHHILLGINFRKEYLFLFYYDRLGYSNEREEKWKRIQDPDLFSDFIVRLYERDLLAVPEQYQNLKSYPVLLALAKDMPRFDFHAYNQSIRLRFKKIDEEKDRLIRIIDNLDSDYLTASFIELFEEFIPKSDDVLDELVQYASEKLSDLSPHILWLFYGEKYDQIKCRDYYEYLVKHDLENLAKFLLDHKKVHVSNYSSVENLSSVLQKVSVFDLIQIQNIYAKYAVYADLAQKMHEYYSKEEIISSSPLSFSELVSVVKDTGDIKLSNILAISEKLIESNSDFSKFKQSVSRASCTLFLFSSSNFHAREMCEIVVNDSVAIDILYHNMDKKDIQSLITEKILLKKIITESLPPKIIDRKFLAIFTEGLYHRVLYHSKTEMMQQQKTNVDIEIQNLSEIKDELEELESSLELLLNQEIENDEKMLEYAIESQIIQAYMITKKGKESSLPVLEDLDKLQEIADEINLGVSVKEFLILGKNKETPGHSTRIGVVPLNMDFDEFSQKFNELYKTAISHIAGNELDKAKFSLNMIRIMTSEAAFNPIRFGQSDEDDLHHIIEGLLKKNFSYTSKLQLVATFQNDTGKTGVREILERVLDEKHISSFISKELSVNSLNASMIVDIMNDNSFTEKLYQRYNVKSFTKLCKIIYASKTADFEQSKNVFSSHITQILQSQNSSIVKGECDTVSDILFAKIVKFGRVLS